MCLGVPMKLVEIDGEHGRVEMGGVKRRVVLSLVENVKAGDYVVVHAGFAIARMNEEEAEETVRLLNECLGKADS